MSSAARVLVALPFPELELVERRPRGRPLGGETLIDAETPYEDDARAQYVVAHHPEGLTLEEVGQLIGCTRERVRQIEARALEKLYAADPEGLRALLDELLARGEDGV